MRFFRSLRLIPSLCVAFSVALAFTVYTSAQSFSASADTSSALSIPTADQITPDQLQHALSGSVTAQPLVIQVGSHLMFDQEHIPYASYAGPGSQPQGLDQLARALAPVPKNRAIVIYCGCCPWSHCPNIAPAYRKLRALGYTNVKALYLAHNFGEDWVAKGYPTQRTR